jgi:hypothetical protein
MVKSKLRLIVLASALLAAGVFVSVSYRFLAEEKKVDDCLSGRHGSFDYSTMSCDLETNHPYVPYGVRHPRDERIAQTAFVCFVGFLSCYFFIRRG